MASQGSFAIITDKENKKVLLVKRKDWPIWDLPGGGREKDEKIIECAVRETLEETGYSIKVLDKIGQYNIVKQNNIQHIFLADIIGGNPITNGDETSKLAWFPLNRLPLFMVPHRKEQIRDYISGIYPIEKDIKGSSVILSLINKIKTN